jgi:hypothetical protein
VTVADVALAITIVGVGGVPGAAIGLTELDAAEAAEVPEPFVAVAENV